MSNVYIHHPDDRPRRLRSAPAEVTRACRIRFDNPGGECATTRSRKVFKWDPQNWWDGWTPIRRLDNGNLEFNRYDGLTEEFDLEGRTVAERRPT